MPIQKFQILLLAYFCAFLHFHLGNDQDVDSGGGGGGGGCSPILGQYGYVQPESPPFFGLGLS